MMYNSYNPGFMMDMANDQRINTQPGGQDDDFEFVDEDFDVRRVPSTTMYDPKSQIDTTDRPAGVYVNGKRIESRKNEIPDDRSIKSMKSNTSSASKKLSSGVSSGSKPGVMGLADRRKMVSAAKINTSAKSKK